MALLTGDTERQDVRLHFAYESCLPDPKMATFLSFSTCEFTAGNRPLKKRKTFLPGKLPPVICVLAELKYVLPAGNFLRVNGTGSLRRIGWSG